MQIDHFVETECIPADGIFEAQISTDPAKRWTTYPKIIDELKEKARYLYFVKDPHISSSI